MISTANNQTSVQRVNQAECISIDFDISNIVANSRVYVVFIQSMEQLFVFDTSFARETFASVNVCSHKKRHIRMSVVNINKEKKELKKNLCVFFYCSFYGSRRDRKFNIVVNKRNKS